MAKILGIDAGTNSLGLFVRNTDNGNNFIDQIEFFNSIIFKSGVGKGKTGEYSYASKRTKYRSTRRLYQARKYRIWSTLKLLIEYDYCPLSMEDLEKWCKYDKKNNIKRQYPTDCYEFEQWIRLDFDGDGKPEYSSPYQLRAELLERQLDLNNPMDRYKLGRALYHIAQHRGFKSSKGETIKEQEENEKLDYEKNDSFDISSELKKSEQKKSSDLTVYMAEHNLKTVGCAFYHLEQNNIRIRDSKYQAVRSQYKEEIETIFKFQNEIDINSYFCKRILSEKKGEGTIFYKRPLRSQKGAVGKCTLEPNKARCPISHPDFEEYRAWCFINNIKYRQDSGLEWETLPIELKEKLFAAKFMRTASYFKFSEIAEWLSKELGYKLSYKDKTINYKENTSVSGCPISGRLKNLLGEEWKQWQYETTKERTNKKTGEIHSVKYNYESLWHICFSYDDPDYIEEFAKENTNFTDKQIEDLKRIWGAIQQGYAALSLKAIHNIIPFLKKGFLYSEAVLLAKLPDIFDDKWNINQSDILANIEQIMEENRQVKRIRNIANTLIANYKSLEVDERFAEHDTTYTLTDVDKKEVEKTILATLGKKEWDEKDEASRNLIFNEVSRLYQEFFYSSKRDYYRLPKLSESLAEYLKCQYEYLTYNDLKKIYHPSMIDIYPASKYTKIDDRSLKLLGSPVVGAMKNPVVLRALHVLRKEINDLIKNGLIDEDTRIVVETAREMNDSNMRWAIERYQKTQEEQNKKIESIIKEYFPNRDINNDDIRKMRFLIEQADIVDIDNDNYNSEKFKSKTDEILEIKKDNKDVKYRLWLEQNARCIYTGNIINITKLFDPNVVDIEHTIPRSISFDDSMSNLTVCFLHFNRNIKKKQIPSQLNNYDDILRRIQPWIDKVEKLKENIEYWKVQAKRSQTKERKDECIRKRHLLQMDLEYWEKKVNTFKLKVDEINSGFKSSQLNDTRIITKYIYHYLKSLFTSVDVQKGSITAVFRKIAEIESMFEKKDRSKHSHHAIDAAILTLIPPSAKRTKIIELYYNREECDKHSEEYNRYDSLLKKEMQSLPKDILKIKDFIEENIIVKHTYKDQTLTPAKRKVRRRGKIVFLRDKEGKLITDENGKCIEKISTGDCIRGQLHEETFLGAITQNKDFNKIFYVKRIELKYKNNASESGFKNWDDIKKVIVDKKLFEIMKGQFPEETDLKTALDLGIYMLNKHGEKVNKIRHIRCYARSTNPLQIKKQTYKSDKDYKNFYYAAVGDSYAICKYETSDKKEKQYEVINLFEISENRKHGIDDIPTSLISKKKKELVLSHTLVSGDMVLLYKDTLEELYDMDNSKLINHLYIVKGFESDRRITLVQTINAQTDKELGIGETIKDFNNLPSKIRTSINSLNYLVCGIDFDIINGNIEFFNRK